MLSISFTAPSFSLRRVPTALDAVRARRAAREESGDYDGAPSSGWFDSSYELQRGLAVSEHGDLDDDASVALAVALWLA